MQLRSWLAVSVVVNAGLLTALVATWRGGAQETATVVTPPAGLEMRALQTPEAGQGPDPATTLPGLRDVLRSAGVEPELIAQVLRGKLLKERSRVRRASSWWKGSPYSSALVMADPLKMYEDEQELDRLMDEFSVPAKEAGSFELAYLPEAKRAMVARIFSDYLGISRQHKAAGLYVAADQNRDQLLREEMQRDLRNVLTAEEYLEYTLRDLNSMDWGRLRMDAVSLDLTEQEFRETARSLLIARAITDEKARAEAVEQIHEDLRTMVGSDRIFTARAKSSFEYYQLREAQVRFQFSQTATDRVIGVWQKTYDEASALSADKAMEKATREESWRTLAANTREQIMDALGPEPGTAYLAQSMDWLRNWDRGEDTPMSGGLMGRR